VYFFYGIGSNVQEDDREQFSAAFPSLRFDYLRKLRPNLYLGLRYHFDDFDITSIEENAILDNKNIRGNEGGRLSGLGPMIYYDSRDSQLYPTKGIFAEASIQSYNKSISSECQFSRWQVVLEVFIPLRPNRCLYGMYMESFVRGASIFLVCL